MENNQKVFIQSKVFEFAYSELVRSHRDSFQPLWTVDSWVKFLIWIALNCGFSGDKESIASFLDALGAQISIRMRRIFFERILEEHGIHLMADPAESQALLLPIKGEESITLMKADLAVKDVALTSKLEQDKNFWKFHNGMISIPWKNTETCS